MKRTAVLFLLIASALKISACNALTAEPIYARLVVPFFCSAEIPRDMDLIEEELNRITRKKIGAEIDLIPLLALADQEPDARRKAELNLLEKEDIFFDLFCDELRGYEERAIPLEGLLKEYGRDILAVMGDELLNKLCIDENIYTLPSVSDYVISEGISMRKDIVEKYNIDLSQIHSAQDLTPVFEIVRKNEPDMSAICGYSTHRAVLSFEINAERIQGCVFSLGEDGELVNYFATDTFRELVELVHSWYLNGFVGFGMSMQNLEASALVSSGELFSYTTSWKPGIEQEVSINCGMEMVTIPLMEPVISNLSSTMRYWGITQNCKNPGKAMQFLNLLYSDSEVANLLAYGIEGVHYTFREDGTIGFPDGVTTQTCGFVNTMPWLLPNQLITLVWERYSIDLWEQLDEYNRSAAISELVGFAFDDSAVAAENAGLNEIVDEYYYGLTSGILDPDIYLPQLLEEMEDSGLETVLSEAQRQYDQWLLTREEAQ